MALPGFTPLLSTPGHVVFLVALMELYFPSPLQAAGDQNVVFSLDLIAIPGGGVPGQDYPTLATVPVTGFSCSSHHSPGYYADTSPEAACQVFHICQGDGRQDSFLCPNGTVFSQQHLVCDWWYSVDCAASTQSEKKVVTFVRNQRPAASLLAGSGSPGGEDGAIIRPPHDTLAPPTATHSHQQPHLVLQAHTHSSVHHSMPQTTSSPGHQSSPSVGQTHQSVTHHSLAQSHHPDRPPTITSHQPIHHILPGPLVTHSHHPNNPASPRPTATHSGQSPTPDHQTHPFHPQSTVTQHSPVQTLFREDVSHSLTHSLPHHPAGRRNRVHQPPLKPGPRGQHSQDSTNTHLISTPRDDDHSTSSPLLREQESIVTISHQVEGNQVGRFDASLNELSYSREFGSLQPSVPASLEFEHVEYDNVYSATLFPPNIPSLGDVYEAAKGRIIVEVVKESHEAPSFLPSSVPVQENTRPKSTSLQISKVPYSVKESLRLSQAVNSQNPPSIQDLLTRDESLPSASISAEDAIVPSPHDHNSLYRPSHPHRTPTGSDAKTEPTFPTHHLPSQHHEPHLPLHVWRPSQNPRAAPVDAALAPDTSFNVIDPYPQRRDAFIVTTELFHASDTHPASHESFKVIHDTSPSGHASKTPQQVYFPSEQDDTTNSPKLPSVSSHDSIETSGHFLKNSSPASLESPPPDSRALFHTKDSSYPQVSSGIRAAPEASNPPYGSFAVIQDSSPTNPGASHQHQPRPAEPRHPFRTPHRFTL